MKDIKVKNEFNLVADQLRSAHRVLAVTHFNPDGDALGSLCFFKELMDKLNKECVIYCAGPLPSSLEFLDHWSEIVVDKNKINFNNFDLIVSLDCATVGRTNLEKEITNRKSSQIFLEIDHHPALVKVANLVLRLPEAASTTEILFQLAEAMAIEINSIMARALLTGILTDTSHFVHSTVTTKTIKAASTVISRGANLAKLYNQTAKNKTLAGLKIWGIALSRLVKNSKNGLIYTVLTADDFKELDVSEDVIEGISSFLSGLNEGKIFMILYEKEGMVRGSLRSLASGVDVAKIAYSLGGGGHVRAAGFMVKGHLSFKNGLWQVNN